jgi:hypothetical protein
MADWYLGCCQIGIRILMVSSVVLKEGNVFKHWLIYLSPFSKGVINLILII